MLRFWNKKPPIQNANQDQSSLAIPPNVEPKVPKKKRVKSSNPIKHQAFIDRLLNANLVKGIKEKFIEKKVQAYAIITSVAALVMLLWIICLAPLTFKNKMIIAQAASLGIDMQINGVVNFNIFTLSLVITDSKLTLNHRTNKKCTVAADLRVPRVKINLVTNTISVTGANIDVVAVNQGELHAFIAQMFHSDIMDLSAVDTTINIIQCPHTKYQDSKIDNMSSMAKQLHTPIEQQITIDYLQLLFDDTRHSLKVKLHDNYNNYCNLDYNNVTFLDKIDINIDSNLMQFNLELNKSKATGHLSTIGQYKINIPNLAPLYRIVSKRNFRFISNVLSNTPFKTSGMVLYHQNVIKVYNTFDTSYGKGNFKITVPKSGIPSISLSFANIDSSKYQSASLEDADSGLRVMDFVLASMLRSDHRFQMEVKNIDFDHNHIDHAVLAYRISNQRLYPEKMELKLADGIVQYIGKDALTASDTNTSANLSPNPTSKEGSQHSDNDTTIRLNMHGKNVAALAVVVEAIMASSNIFATARSEAEKLPYSGNIDLSLDLNGDLGVKNFELKIKDSAISGAYLSRAVDNTDSTKIIKLHFSKVDFGQLFTRRAIRQMMQYDKITAAMQVKEIGTPLSSLHALFFAQSEPEALALSIVDSSIAGESISHMDIMINHHANYIDLQHLNIDSSFISGSGNFSMKTDGAQPEIKTAIKIDKLNLNILERMLKAIMIEQDDSNMATTLRDWMKNSIKYLYSRYKWQISVLEELSGVLDISVNNISYMDNNLSQLSIVTQIANQVIRIDRVSLDVFGGNVDINGAIYLHKVPKAALNVSSRNLDLVPLLNSVFNINNVISGKLTTTNSLIESHGSNWQDMIRNLHGKIDLNIDQFTIQKINATGLYQALSSKRRGNIDPMKILTNGGGTAFPTARGTIMLHQGKLRTSGISAKTVGVSHIIGFSFDIIHQVMDSMEGRFLVLARDPRPGFQYVNIPLAFKVAGSLSNPQLGIFTDRVIEYLHATSKMNMEGNT